jgi:ABC-type transport system involved in cytochrome c biogenesis permease subunit
MDRLSVLCFGGTYALALGSELARFLPALRDRARGWVTSALIGLGLAVQTVYLINRARETHALPVTTSFESLLTLGWVLAAIALYLVARSGVGRPSTAGAAVLALALAALTVAGLWAPRASARADWSNIMTFWGATHGVFLMLGAASTCLAFAFGLMYLAQARRLKRKEAGRRALPLPSLEQSERWHRGAIALAFPFLTAGMLIGLGLVLATQRAGQPALRWTDPKIISTVALWLVFAALLHARYQADWQGRRVMILTIVAFALMAVAMGVVGLVLPTGHGGLAVLAGRDAAAPPAARPGGAAP